MYFFKNAFWGNLGEAKILHAIQKWVFRAIYIAVRGLETTQFGCMKVGVLVSVLFCFFNTDGHTLSTGSTPANLKIQEQNLCRYRGPTVHLNWDPRAHWNPQQVKSTDTMVSWYPRIGYFYWYLTLPLEPLGPNFHTNILARL